MGRSIMTLGSLRSYEGNCNERHNKIELCIKLHLLRSFHVGHIEQNRQSALSPALHEWFSCKGKE